MIDPGHSLAFSIQSNPGVYAVLIGSGVSRATGIPTGWEVTLDLVRKLAAVHQEAPEPDPETWFANKFGTDPDYSDLLDQIAKTQAERQQLLRAYFEPTEEERVAGEKAPTVAHHAIAALAADGFVKIVVTTNFDRLMEQALSAAGIEATVLSTEDHICGAPPLDHLQHLVVKVHGDYRDVRILNTGAELEEYPQAVNDLLDRIFNEYGLIVCGWSGEWDPALRAALERASARRYTTYWTTRSRPSDDARALIARRSAEVVEIADANSFFEKLKEDVAAIDEFSRPHPLSADIAVTKLKRYLPEPRYRIQLADLIEGSVQEIIERTAGDAFSPNAPKPTRESIVKRLKTYDAACSTLTAMAAAGGGWAETEHYSLWHRAIQHVCRRTQPGRAYRDWLDLQRYPGTLLLYALGLGAVDRGHLEFLRSLLEVRVQGQRENDAAAVWSLPPTMLLESGGSQLHGHGGFDDRQTPLNSWIHDTLLRQTRNVFRDDGRFTTTFDKLEILLALGIESVPGWAQQWTLPGCFFWRGTTRDRFLTEIKESLEAWGGRSAYVNSGICGHDSEDCRKRIERLEDKIAEVGWDMRFKLERIRQSRKV